MVLSEVPQYDSNVEQLACIIHPSCTLHQRRLLNRFSRGSFSKCPDTTRVISLPRFTEAQIQIRSMTRNEEQLADLSSSAAVLAHNEEQPADPAYQSTTRKEERLMDLLE